MLEQSPFRRGVAACYRVLVALLVPRDMSGQLVLLSVISLMLTGCYHQPAAPVALVSVAILKNLVDKMKEDLGWWFGFADIPEDEAEQMTDRAKKVRILTDRHKGFFAYRRAMILGREHPEWLQDDDFDDLRDRIGEEIAEVEAFISARFSEEKNLLLDAPDGASDAADDEAFTCKEDAHIDLANVVRVQTNRAPAGDLLRTYRRLRQDSARSIVWRAAALHGGPNGTGVEGDHWSLWNNTGSSGSRLNTTELKVLLDRRLRLIERMRLQVNSWVHSRGSVKRKVPGGGPKGPWEDFVRTQIFQYPFLSLDQEPLIAPVDASLWRRKQDEFTWEWFRPTTANPERTVDTKLYPEGNVASESAVWVPEDDYGAYTRDFNGASLAVGMDSLMTANLDYWQRGWLYCDLVCCALQLDALRFGLKRKLLSDDFFDEVAKQAGRKIALTAPLGTVPADVTLPDAGGDGSLLDGGHGQAAFLFENRFIATEDIQAGDHTIFWNHHVYLAFWSGAFRLENAVVTAVDSEPFPDAGGIKAPNLLLEGHGMPSQSVPGFQTEMVGSINSGFRRARADAKRANAEGLEAFVNWRRHTFVKWMPYPGITFDADEVAGPWFVYLPRLLPRRRARWTDVNHMFAAVAHSVIDDTTPSSGYAPLPFTVSGRPLAEPGEPTPALQTLSLHEPGLPTVRGGVLFPLYQPSIPGRGRVTWRQYFDARRDAPTLEVTLLAYRAPRDIIPGFFIGGRTPYPAHVLRPKAQV